MRDLGRIVRLQIQRASLKTGEKPTRVYDPAPLLAVDRLALGPDGALGAGSDGSWVVDVHHRTHPNTKNEDGAHGVSIGFTTHYALMRERFGDRLTPAARARMSSWRPLAGSPSTSSAAASPSWTRTAARWCDWRCCRSRIPAGRSAAGRWAARSNPRSSRKRCSSWTTECAGSTAWESGRESFLWVIGWYC